MQKLKLNYFSVQEGKTEWLPSIPQSKIEYSPPTKEGKMGDAKSIYVWNYSWPSIKRSPIKQPLSIKQPVIIVPK